MQKTKLFCEALDTRVLPANCTWNYYGAGIGDASQSSNWIGGLPGSDDKIFIPDGTGSMTIAVSSVVDFEVADTWDKSITFTSSMNITGVADFNDCTINLNANLTFSGTGFFEDCVIVGGAANKDVIVAEGGSCGLKGDNVIDISSFRNYGYLGFNQSATTLTEHPSAVYNCMLRNYGELYISQAGAESLCDLNTHNSGQMLFECAAGSMNITWGGYIDNNGAVILAGDVTLSVNGYLNTGNEILETANIINQSDGGGFWHGNLYVGTTATLDVPHGVFSEVGAYVGSFEDYYGGDQATIVGDVYIQNSSLGLDYYDLSYGSGLPNGSGDADTDFAIEGSLYLEDADVWFNLDFGLGRANHLYVTELVFCGNDNSAINFNNIYGQEETGDWWLIESDYVFSKLGGDDGFNENSAGELEVYEEAFNGDFYVGVALEVDPPPPGGA